MGAGPQKKSPPRLIHIATVHWQTPKWIDIQLKYIKRFINESYRVYTYLNGFPAHEHNKKFFYASNEDIQSHAPKLNKLAQMISEKAESDDDIIIFLDGDAFPIAPLAESLREKLSANALTAIVQRENNGDRQPHPSFCATTVGFWKKMKGDWLLGATWTNDLGLQVYDVGGHVLNALEENGAAWLPLYRSNKFNLHPLWFGIYADLIYHHGSGFRTPQSRLDELEVLRISQDAHVKWLFEQRLRGAKPTSDGIGDPSSPYGVQLAKHTAELEERFAQVFKKIETDDEFFREFLKSAR